MQKRPFVLSGGGARGFAHLGAIKAFAENGIVPSAISGTSSGAIAGAFLADGYTPDEVKDIFIGNMKLNLLAWNFFKSGLISTKNIQEFLQKHLRAKNIEDLALPFYVTATNFIDGSQMIFDSGNLIERIVAASSIPILFPPVFIHNIPFIDGGLANNLPIEPFQRQKEQIISIHVNPLRAYSPNETVLEVMDRSLHLSFRKMVEESAQGCYLYLEPTALNKFGIFDLNKIQEIFDIGYNFTKAHFA